MALSRSVQLSVSATCVATLLGLAASGIRAEEGVVAKPYTYGELRFGYVSAPGADVRQVNSDSATGLTPRSYNGSDSRGFRVGVTYLSGSVPPENLLAKVWGAQISLGSYSIGDQGVTTRVIQPMVDLYYGWQYGIMETQTLRGFGEFLPYVGVGGSHVKIEEKARLGYAVETGLRFGAYLTERTWTAGLTTSYVLGFSKIKGDQQSLELKTNGFTFGGEFGFRF